MDLYIQLKSDASFECFFKLLHKLSEGHVVPIEIMAPAQNLDPNMQQNMGLLLEHLDDDSLLAASSVQQVVRLNTYFNRSDFDYKHKKFLSEYVPFPDLSTEEQIILKLKEIVNGNNNCNRFFVKLDEGKLEILTHPSNLEQVTFTDRDENTKVADSIAKISEGEYEHVAIWHLNSKLAKLPGYQPNFNYDVPEEIEKLQERHPTLKSITIKEEEVQTDILHLLLAVNWECPVNIEMGQKGIET